MDSSISGAPIQLVQFKSVAEPVTLPVRLPKIPPEAVRTPVIVVEALMVEEAVERKPWRKPRVVEVELPYDSLNHGNEKKLVPAT